MRAVWLNRFKLSGYQSISTLKQGPDQAYCFIEGSLHPLNTFNKWRN